MSKLIIVSNKLPYDITIKGDQPVITEKEGGITSSLNSFYKFLECAWVGWPGNEAIDLTGRQKEIL